MSVWPDPAFVLFTFRMQIMMGICLFAKKNKWVVVFNQQSNSSGKQDFYTNALLNEYILFGIIDRLTKSIKFLFMH